ncbi:Helix-turn-helix [Frankineae bacterium MT45]|nr:Helix-turn-helix [Frankineae bacterium MT45]
MAPDDDSQTAVLTSTARTDAINTTSAAEDDDPPPSREYAKALGARLRAIRGQQHLSLHAVERKSDGKWKAVVVGSYERGDRAVSVQRLAELADFYRVPVSVLLPSEDHPGSSSATGGLAKIVLNLERLHSAPAEEVTLLTRFVGAIQRERGDYGNRVLSIRAEDLRTLAILYDTTVEALTERLVRWQVLAPDSLILDGEP